MRELIDPVAREIKPPLAFRLEVGLEESIDPLWEHDLDNYLFPNHKLGIRVGLPWAALVPRCPSENLLAARRRAPEKATPA